MKSLTRFLGISISLLLFTSLLFSRQSTLIPSATPESQGISSSAILKFIEKADQEIDAMHSIMILRHGNLITKGWWAPFNPENPHIMHSLSKSFTSTAIGFAVDEGLLSIYDPVISFFPDDTPENPSQNLRSMRVIDLLTMNTGHITPPSPDGNVKNWAKLFLEKDVDLKPGTHFKYNSMATYMLSAIMHKLTGQSLVEFLQPRLFDPLGIKTPRWDKCPMGLDVGGWGLHIVTEDIARFGQLYLQKGKWEGKQLISEKWVEMATSRQVSNGSDPDSDWDQGYGFQFWQCRHNCYRGDGAFGQYCIVMPEQDAVIAITSASDNMGQVMQLIWDYLLPEFKNESLPENPEAFAKLESKTYGLKVKPVEGDPQSPISRNISRKTYLLRENPAGLKSVSFDLNGNDHSIEISTEQNTQTIPVGTGKYLKGSDEKLLPFTGNLPSKIAASGAWISANEYKLRVYFYEDTGRINYTFKFDGDELSWDSNLEFTIFNPVEPLVLTGSK